MARETFRRSDAYQISELLYGIVDQMEKYFGVVTAETGLTAAQGRLLLELDEPATMRGLAERLGCDPSNITGLVDRMDQRGLLRRRADVVDRRIRWIELTANGQEMLDRLHARFATDEPSVLSLDQRDRSALLALLRRVHDAESIRLESATSGQESTDARGP